MIVDRQVFQYQNKNLIERVIISPPFRYEVIFEEEGCLMYVKGADTKLLSPEQKLELEDKEIALLKCGVYFVEWLQKRETTIEVIAFHLHADILKKLYKEALPKAFKKRSEHAQSKKLVPDNMILKFVESLEFYFQNPAIVNDDLLELKIKEMILLLIQSNNATSILELIEEMYTPRVTELKKVIEVHLYENLSVQELATLCNLSLSSFKREFNTIYKDTPMNFITTKKIQKAKKLLEVSDLSISDVSYQVGFNDPYYFTRVFKKKEGMPPSAYRKQDKD